MSVAEQASIIDERAVCAATERGVPSSSRGSC